MPAVISLERPDTPDAEALITELDAQLEQLYPAMSRHGYSVDKLLTEGVAFFVIRDGGAVPEVGVGSEPLPGQAAGGGVGVGGIEHAGREGVVRGIGLPTQVLEHGGVSVHASDLAPRSDLGQR